MENPFAAWIRKVGLTKHAVAVAWGMLDPGIGKITRAGYRPNRENLLRIWRFTGGEVTPDAMLLTGEQPAEQTADYRRGLRAIRAANEEREKADAAKRKKQKARKARTEGSRTVEQRPE